MDLKQTIAELEQRLQASLAERDELLLQQIATAEILKTIKSSPDNLAPVFNAIAERSNRLIGGIQPESSCLLMTTFISRQSRR